MPTDETNQLLREIRDILASQDAKQEAKYDDHLKKIQETYMQQIQINEQQRKKSVRVVFVMLLMLVIGLGMVMYAFSMK